MRGPTTRSRRTTISGGGVVSPKHVNRGKLQDNEASKPPQYPVKAKTAAGESSHVSHNGKVGRDVGVSGKQHLTSSPKKQRSAVEDINNRLR